MPKISTLYKEFTSTLERLTTHEDRHIKGHSLALLKRLQDINPQDEIN